ncbi:hypothetical protein [Holzapfeliella sp. JNUCC 80]
MKNIYEYDGKLIEPGSGYYHIELVTDEVVNVRFGHASQYIEDLSNQLKSTLNALFCVGVSRSDVDWILDCAMGGQFVEAEMILSEIGDERMVQE